VGVTVGSSRERLVPGIRDSRCPVGVTVGVQVFPMGVQVGVTLESVGSDGRTSKYSLR